MRHFLADFLGNCAIAFPICPLMRQKCAFRYFGPLYRSWWVPRPVSLALAVAAGLLPLVVPGTLSEPDAGRLAAAVIVAASYVALAIASQTGIEGSPRCFSTLSL